MSDVGSLEFQLSKLQLTKVTSTNEVIGKGAFGRVVKVHVHGTLCAAKEIHPLLVESSSSQEFDTIRKSFYEECIRASRMHHPNVVQMLGIYYPTPQAKLPWLVMEMMQTSLKGFLEKYEQTKVPLHFKLAILVDVAQGLEFLHGQDIVHRDLSSNNVLLTKHLVAKIADLGVAKVIQENKMKTHTQVPGTTHFMPPEALKNRPRYGKPVDVFSLACITLHVMSHQWPEPKDLLCEDTMTALTEMQRRDEYVTFCVQPALKELVELCLHNKPEQRPEISDVCVKLNGLKVIVEKQVSFATDNWFELFDVVQHVRVQCQKLSAANTKLTDDLACLEAIVQIQNKEKCLLTQENDHLQQIQEKYQKLQGKDEQLQGMDQQLQGKDWQIREKDQQLREKDQQLRDKDQQLREKDQQLQEKDQQLREKDQQLQEKDKQIQGKDGQIREKDQLLQEKDQQLQEKDKQIKGKDGQIQEKDQLVQEKDKQLQEKEKQIQRKDGQIRERDQQIQAKHQIQRKDQEIDQQTKQLQNIISTGVHQNEMVHPTISAPPNSREIDTVELVHVKSTDDDHDDNYLIKESTQLGYRSPPASKSTEQPKNTSDEAINHLLTNTNTEQLENTNNRAEVTVGNLRRYSPAKKVTEEPFDTSTLSPPYFGEMYGELRYKDSTQLGYRNPPEMIVSSNLKHVVEQSSSDYRPFGSTPPITSPSAVSITPLKNTNSRAKVAIGHTHRDPPTNNTTCTEQHFDPSALSPPELGDMSGKFGSVPQHINPSSHIDDDEDQLILIKDNTQLGYHNPPEAKFQLTPSNLKPVVEQTSSNYRPFGSTPPITSPSVSITPLENTSSRGESARSHPHRDPPAEQSIDLSKLPPPYLKETSEFGSVIPHINLSSHIDDDENQLIKDSTQLGYRNPPGGNFQLPPSNLKPVVERTSSNYRPFGSTPPITSPSVSITPLKNTSSRGESAKSHPHRDPPAEQSIDLSKLPPPHLKETGEFGSVIPHINLSSHTDDDENQLIKDSTQLGYRNPPGGNFQLPPSNLKPVVERTSSNYRPFGSTPPITSPSVSITPLKNTSSRGESAKSHPHRDPPAEQSIDLSKLPPPHLKETGEFGSVIPHINLSSHIDDDENQLIKDSTQLGYRNPPGGNFQLPPSNLKPVVEWTSSNYRPFGSTPPITSPSVSTTPLKNTSSRAKVAIGHPHKDPPTNNATEQHFDPSALPPPELGDMSGEFGSVLQHINPSSHIDDDESQLIKDSTQLGYHNTPIQVVSSELKTAVGWTPVPLITSRSTGTSITLLPNRDHKFDNTCAKVSSTSAFSHSVPYHHKYKSKTKTKAATAKRIPDVLDDPQDEKPVVDQSTVSSDVASNTTHSTSISSSYNYTLWQCAHCQEVNEVHYSGCKHCKLSRGRLADGSIFCEFCQLMIFVPARGPGEHTDICCPRCKKLFITHVQLAS